MELLEIKNALVALTAAVDRKINRKPHANNQLRFSTGTRPFRQDFRKQEPKVHEVRAQEARRPEQDSAEPSSS
jgi:hypothetical protein